MNSRLRRILFYMVLAAALYGIATFFTDSRAAFVGVFSIGVLIGVTADILFWIHIFTLRSRRRRARHAD